VQLLENVGEDEEPGATKRGGYRGAHAVSMQLITSRYPSLELTIPQNSLEER
jgi:hypothetical protein